MKIKLKPQTVFEIGAGDLSNCVTTKWWKDPTIQVTCFEPCQSNIESLSKQSYLYPNVEIIPKAIWDYNGFITLNNKGSNSFVEGVESPIVQHDRKNNLSNSENLIKTQVPCSTIDVFDKGNIDILIIDTEGSEWFALKHLKSRPLVILIELEDKKYYKNSNYDDIMKWMKINGYFKVQDRGCDGVFLKSDLFLLNINHDIDIS